jgi:hypothetical protein
VLPHLVKVQSLAQEILYLVQGLALNLVQEPEPVLL